MTGCSSETDGSSIPVRVEIVETDAGYRLFRDGAHYEIKGAGMPIDDLERFAAHGGNSIRTWTTTDEDQNVRDLLDSAYANGVTVALGLPVAAERFGFDYSDSLAVAAQLDALREEVLEYRDHPALLFWIIGNELNQGFTNPAVYDAVNGIARMIDEVDPNHPTTTAVSVFDSGLIGTIKTRAPDLDFISFQLYGQLFGLPEAIEEIGFEDPFMVTEWGAIGYWEMETTTWGAPTEMTSSEKADTVLRGYRDILASFDDRLIGSYVFLWGQKQERTPTWFGMITESGEETEAVDVMHYLWNGAWPANRSPRVNSMLLAGKTAKQSIVLYPGVTYEATLDAFDHEGDPLKYRWEVKPESDSTQTGGDYEEPIPSLERLLPDTPGATTMLTAPAPGTYRLFGYVYDDHGHAAHANIPFKVDEHVAQRRTDLLSGEVMAVAYSGYREGQHPDRGDGAANPSSQEILEDLEILLAHDFHQIRMYDSGENTRTTLALIRAHDIPIKVLLGIWLRAEVSNHLRCPWLDEPIPKQELSANVLWNDEEVRRGIALATEFSDIVVAVNVGNEALVDWTDHMVPIDRVIAHVRQVRAAVDQPVTVADNYAWWMRDGAQLEAVVDFVGVHTYPVWEERTVDEALAYTIENIEGVRAAMPGKPISVLEAGWATVATEFPDRASESAQARYFRELRGWATTANITVFFFEAFDEPWKGDESNLLGAEKHWGLFNVDRTPKQVMHESRR